MILATIAYALLLAVGCVLVLMAARELTVQAWRGRDASGRALAARLQGRRRAGGPVAVESTGPVDGNGDVDVVVFFGAFGIAFFVHWAVSAATGSVDLTESGQRALMDAVIATAALVLARMRAPARTRRWPGVRRGWAAYLLAAILGALGALTT